MTAKEYDVAIIGSGPGGYVAAARSAQHGFKTVCIEKNKTFGGTCLNVGCIPSKALLQSTEYLDFIRKKAAEHGIGVQKVKVNFDEMMKRKEAVVKSLTDGVAGIFRRNHVDSIQGIAKLTGHHHIAVKTEQGEEQIVARNIVLATGSEPVALPFLPFNEKTVLSSTGALALNSIPGKMIVIGGGYIGVEIASVFNRLGTQVTIVEMLDQICMPMDRTIRKNLLQTLKKQGIEFYLGAKVAKAQKNGNTYALTVVQEGKEIQLSADVVLAAVGRRPYYAGLGLEELGIAPAKGGFIPVDGSFRTRIPSIYAIGDVIDGPMLAHKASEEGIAAIDIIAGKKPHLNYMAIPGVVYTHPEAAAVGLTEDEARAAGLSLMIGECQFKANPRARAVGEMEGLVKIIGEYKTGRLIGMHILGIEASELIHEGMLAIEKQATLQDLAYSPQAHPTLGEAIKEASLAALGEAIHL